MVKAVPRILWASGGSEQPIEAVVAMIDQLRPGGGGLSFPAGWFSAVIVDPTVAGLPRHELREAILELVRVLHQDGAIVCCLDEGGTDLLELLRSAGLADCRLLSSRALSHTLFPGREPASDLVAARRTPLPHAWDEPLEEDEFRRRMELAQEWAVPTVSYVIPVRNEGRGLPRFLDSVTKCGNARAARREFVFVLNGCTDNSATLVQDFIDTGHERADLIESGVGIVTAMLTGIERRTFDGWVGKLDADTILHPHVLDLMEACVSESKAVRVAYAEPTPLEPPSGFDRMEQEPSTLSRRCFFTSKACVSRAPDLASPTLAPYHGASRAEDILLSHYYAYYGGLDAMRRASHALVYAKTVQSFADLVAQVARAESDLQRLYTVWPAAQVLEPVFHQALLDDVFAPLLKRAQGEASYVEEWTRIESTK